MALGAIFDADGTLLDSMPLWRDAGKKYLMELGIDAAAGLSAQLRDASLSYGAAYLIDNYGLKTAEGTPMAKADVIKGLCGVVERGYREEVPFKKGVKEALETLTRRKVPWVIATATDRVLLKSALERLGVHCKDEAILTCEEMHTTKDSADIYIAAAARLGVPRSRITVFEDTLRYARTAKSSGFGVVGVADDGAKEDWPKLRDVCCKVIHDFTEIDWQAF